MQCKMSQKLTFRVTITDEIKDEPLIRRAQKEERRAEREFGVEPPDDREESEIDIEVPSTVEICGHCSGEGKHSKRFGAFSGDRLAEAMEDEDFWEGYTSGAFDERCDRCDGEGRVRVPAENLPEWLSKQIEAWDEDERETRAIHRAEMRAQYGLEYGPEFGDY